MRTWILPNYRGNRIFFRLAATGTLWVAGRGTALCLILSIAHPAAAQNLRKIPSAEEVISQSRELTRQALAATPEDRPGFFSGSQHLIAEWVRLQPNDPRVLLVRTQAAIASSLEAELARQNAELATDHDINRWNAARAAARDAIAEWKSMAADVKAQLLRRPRGGRGESNELSPKELSALENNCRLQLAIALKNQALCFPPNSADRINSLTQAVEIASALGRPPGEDSAVWPARVEELTCRRLLGDLPAAEKLIRSMTTAQPTANVQPQLQAERLRWHVAADSLDEILAPDLKLPEEKATSGDLELARLEVFIAEWQRAHDRRDENTSARMRAMAVEQLYRMRKLYPGYWSRRAEQHLVKAIPGIEQALGVESLQRAAEDRFRRGNWREAIAAYDQAAEEAEKESRSDRAFGFALAAAKLAAEHEEFIEAGQRYQKLALRDVKRARAADAHLMAIHQAGLAAKAEQPPRFDDYRKLLDEHLRIWPGGKTVAQAYWRLGQLCAAQGEWEAAITALVKLPADDPHRKESLELIVRCQNRQIADLEAAGKRDEALAIVEPLARKRPNDGHLQEQHARILADTTSTAALKQAAEKWVDVRERSKPGSPRWFRAVYGLAKVQFDLGEKSQARSLIKVAELSYPQLGGEEMRAKFQALLKAGEQTHE